MAVISLLISNHPLIDNVKREVSLERLVINCGSEHGEFIEMKTRVDFFKEVETQLFDENQDPILNEDDEPTYEITRVPIKLKQNQKSFDFVSFYATKTSFVDNQGNIVDSDSPDVLMSEYDFFMYFIDKPIIIKDYVLMRITQEDAKGTESRFN